MSNHHAASPDLDDRLEAVERELAGVTAAFAHARRILKTGDVPDLRELPPALDRIQAVVGELPDGIARRFEPRLIALLDDAAGLESDLRQSLARLDGLRQARDTHKQAAAAYRSPDGR